MEIEAWIFLNKLIAQVNKQKKLSLKKYWILNTTKWIRKKSNVFFNGGRNMKPHFPIIGILAHQILSIVRSQIKTKRNFSLTNILAHLGRS
jgi:hypothetical protein